MMSRALAVLVGVAVLAACGPPDIEEAAANRTQAAPPAAAPAAPAPAAVATPERLVRLLNAEPEMPTEDGELAAYFARDLAAAMKAQNVPGELGAIDFDYRWNAQDAEITDVRYESVADGPGGSVIRVTYANFGEPGVTTYELCRRSDSQWRIAEVKSGPDPDSSLRALLGLPADAGEC